MPRQARCPAAPGAPQPYFGGTACPSKDEQLPVGSPAWWAPPSLFPGWVTMCPLLCWGLVALGDPGELQERLRQVVVAGAGSAPHPTWAHPTSLPVGWSDQIQCLPQLQDIGLALGPKSHRQTRGWRGHFESGFNLIRELPKLHLLCLWRALSPVPSWCSEMPMPEAPSISVHLCPRAFCTSWADPPGLVILRKMSCSYLGITSWGCQVWG